MLNGFTLIRGIIWSSTPQSTYSFLLYNFLLVTLFVMVPRAVGDCIKISCIWWPRINCLRKECDHDMEKKAEITDVYIFPLDNFSATTIQRGIHHVNILDHCNTAPWEIGDCIDWTFPESLYTLQIFLWTLHSSEGIVFLPHQRVWRRFHITKERARQIQEEWETLILHHNSLMTFKWISSSMLRPFLFFVSCASTPHQRFQIKNVECMMTCFKILLQSINSAGT